MTIRSMPATREYRDGWDRTFKRGTAAGGKNGGRRATKAADCALCPSAAVPAGAVCFYCGRLLAAGAACPLHPRR
jgi:hypothetical protein